MKIGTRLLFSLYVGFVAASLVYSFYGPAGFFAYRELSSEAAKLERNLDELKKIHAQLTNEFESLRRSPDEIEQHARDLGYMQDDEVLLDVSGIWKKPQSYYAVGRIVSLNPGERSRHSASLIAGMLATAVAFLFAAGMTSPSRRIR